MPSDTYDVVAPSASVEPNKICCIGEDLPLVFRGSMFPEKIEWIHMADNYPSFIPLRPEEAPIGPEKFMSWYPAHSRTTIDPLLT